MNFREYKDRHWFVAELVPDFIEAHTARRFGDACIKGTRVPTDTAAFAWKDKDWDDYCITEQQAFAAYCFEAGYEYHRNRKLKQRIAEGVSEGWRIHNLLVVKAKNQLRDKNGRFMDWIDKPEVINEIVHRIEDIKEHPEKLISHEEMKKKFGLATPLTKRNTLRPYPPKQKPLLRRGK